MQVKNERIAIAWKLFRRVYRGKISRTAFEFIDLCYELASEMVDENSRFDGHHFALPYSRAQIFEIMGIKDNTFRTASKNGISPKQEAINVGLIFEDGGFTKHGDKVIGRKGMILLPLFSDGIDLTGFEVDNIRKAKFGEEETKQYIRQLAELAVYAGRFRKWDEIDYFNENINNHKIIKTDNEQLKELKLQRQFFFLLAKNGIDPLVEPQKHFASITQIFNEIANKQYYHLVEKAIFYLYNRKDKLTEKEINEKLRGITEKLISNALAYANGVSIKKTFEDETVAFKDRVLHDLKRELNDKLAHCKKLETKIALLEHEKDGCFLKPVSVHVLNDYYEYIINCLNNLREQHKKQQAIEQDFASLSEIEFEFNAEFDEDPFQVSAAV